MLLARLGLECATNSQWALVARSHLQNLLPDHAYCEKKAAATALSLISRCPDDSRLVESMLQLAQEELVHFEQLIRILRQRNIPLGRDNADLYVHALLKLVRPAPQYNLGDRLLVFGLVEARSCERFHLLAGALDDEQLINLYQELALREEGHAHIFEQLARRYLPHGEITARFGQMRGQEAAIVQALPNLPRMHG